MCRSHHPVSVRCQSLPERSLFFSALCSTADTSHYVLWAVWEFVPRGGDFRSSSILLHARGLKAGPRLVMLLVTVTDSPGESLAVLMSALEK